MPFKYEHKDITQEVMVQGLKIFQSFSYMNYQYVLLGKDSLIDGRAICMREDGSLTTFYLNTMVAPGPMVKSVSFPV